MALIELNDMRFYSHHGCFDEERRIGTHFRVDLSFVTDTSLAERSDNIEDTVSYLDVYQLVKHEMAQPGHLLEHVAHRIGESVMSQFPDISSVTVKVYKLNPPLGGQLQSVSVQVEKSRQR